MTDGTSVTDASLVTDYSKAAAYGNEAAGPIEANLKIEETMNYEALMQAYKKFVENNTDLDKNETKDEPYMVHKGLEIIIGDNLPLWIAFYKYFGKHEIIKWSGVTLTNKRKINRLAEGDVDTDMYIDPAILKEDSGVLGVILMHEFVHVCQEELTYNESWYSQAPDGKAYAVEQFLLDHLCKFRYHYYWDKCPTEEIMVRLKLLMDMKKKRKILKGEKSSMQAKENATFTHAFNLTYVALRILYGIIEKELPLPMQVSLIPKNFPPKLANLTPYEAKVMTSILIFRKSTNPEDELKLFQLLYWITSNIANLDPPMKYE